MQPQEAIEVLLEKELYGLCTSCEKADHCLYRTFTDKIIIQCHLYEFNLETIVTEVQYRKPGGLCTNCAKADSCQLPDRIVGVWHCEEYV